MVRSTFAKIINKSRGCGDWFHLIGNHELYNFEHRDMPQRLQMPSELRQTLVSSPESGVRNFYSFSPRPGWRFVVLDSYAQSILGRPESDASAAAAVCVFVCLARGFLCGAGIATEEPHVR